MNNSKLSKKYVVSKIKKAMRLIYINPALIYAFEKTGRIVTEENRKLLSEEDLRDWDDAIEEYNKKSKEFKK